MARIAFIGLGTMGLPMAENLLRAGHDLRVHDISVDAVARMVAQGAAAPGTPAAASAGAEVVVTMLPNGAIVGEVLAGEHGLFAAAARQGQGRQAAASVEPAWQESREAGSVALQARDRAAPLAGAAGPLFIDSSTIAPASARAFAAEAAALGLQMVDAPVSGGVERARDATLAFMAGGTPEAVARARPVLSQMGAAVIHAGPAGSGQTAKICNNMLAAVIMAGTAEALALGEAAGIEPALLSEIIGRSSGGSFLLDRWNPWPGVVPEAPASRGYEGGFQLDLMLKDLGLALDAARGAGQAAPMGAVAQSLYALHRAAGEGAGRADFSSIMTMFRKAGPARRTGGD